MHKDTWRTVPAVCAAIFLTACVADHRTENRADLSTNVAGSGRVVTAHAANMHHTIYDLVRNFHDIALSYEFYFDGDRIVNRHMQKPLERWETSIKYRLIGDGVTRDDIDYVEKLTNALSEITGLQFFHTGDRADMLISIATYSGRENISRWFGQAGLDVYKERYDTWRNTSGWICGTTLANDALKPGVLRQAHIFIAAEHAGMRQSCLEEEIAQSLGLPNDSGAAPSIFNDDQRFAQLTEHDKILLRTLYDPRLQPGMTAGEAMPLVEEIIAEMLGSEPESRTARKQVPSEIHGTSLELPAEPPQ